MNNGDTASLTRQSNAVGPRATGIAFWIAAPDCTEGLLARTWEKGEPKLLRPAGDSGAAPKHSSSITIGDENGGR